MKFLAQFPVGHHAVFTLVYYIRLLYGGFFPLFYHITFSTFSLTWSAHMALFCESFLLSCLQISALMHPRYLQCWKVHFLILFLTHIVCLCHFSDVMPYAKLIFLFSGPFVEVLPFSMLWMVPSMLQGFLFFYGILAIEFGFREVFSFAWETLL